MTSILALDLSYVGDTGWVIWDTELNHPVVDWGVWTIKGKGKKMEAEINIIPQIYDNMVNLVTYFDPDIIAYEYTDWHRNISPNDPDWKRQYSIERNAQKTLSLARSALICALHSIKRLNRCIAIGANEAKREFGALRKKAAAELFSDEFSRFRFIRENTDKDPGFLWDEYMGKLVPHHVSDAFVIAYVVARRARLKELVDDAI